MAKWTEIDTQVVEAGQEIPLDTTKTAVKFSDTEAMKRCSGCSNLKWILEYSHYGCFHIPYDGQKITDIDKCPKKQGINKGWKDGN